jgi:hypothetical protein
MGPLGLAISVEIRSVGELRGNILPICDIDESEFVFPRRVPYGDVDRIISCYGEPIQ